MATIGVGIIGWGFMGKTHAQALRSLPLFYPGAGFEVALRGVCARHIENARDAAGALGIDFYTDDYRRLLARDDIDVVSVCTPNDQHEEMAIAAASFISSVICSALPSSAPRKSPGNASTLLT